MSALKSIIRHFKNKSILVVGDLILDRHIVGSVSRISPEAPVPIVLQEDSFFAPGGASNVAQNLRALGAQVTQVGKVGTDADGDVLKKFLRSQGVNVQGIIADKIPTITKTRVIARHQQIVRIDREESDNPGTKMANEKIARFILKSIKKADAVILSDYGKGMITPQIVRLASQEAFKKGIPITVDPKVEHFDCYRKVTAITPNLKEAENAIRNIKIKSSDGHKLSIKNDKLKSARDIDVAGKELLNYLELESLLITLGEHGMRLFERGKAPFAIKTKAQEVYDVTGAGDTVISVFTLALVAGAAKKQAAELSNLASGLVVAKMGAATLTQKELIQALKG